MRVSLQRFDDGRLFTQMENLSDCRKGIRLYRLGRGIYWALSFCKGRSFALRPMCVVEMTTSGSIFLLPDIRVLSLGSLSFSFSFQEYYEKTTTTKLPNFELGKLLQPGSQPRRPLSSPGLMLTRAIHSGIHSIKSAPFASKPGHRQELPDGGEQGPGNEQRRERERACR